MVQRRAYDPFFDLGMKRWIYRTSHKHYWRVASYLDIDDLIQEGFLAYAICRARYKVENRSHMMSLVQITFINQITDLANKRTNTLETLACELPELEDGSSPLENLAGGDSSDAELTMLLAHAPQEVRKLLAALSTNKGADFMRRESRIRKDGTRETRNERFCRLIGVDLFDMEGALRAVLS